MFFKVLIFAVLLSSVFSYPYEKNEESDLNDARKYAEKPNYVKKVALDDVSTSAQTNQIADNSFSWSNMLGVLMQMLFNNNNNNEINAPTKSDDIDNAPASPWANILSVGLRIVTALLGGNNSDGIDKVDDSGATGPMQNVLAAVFTAMFGGRDPDQVNAMAKQAGEFINIVVNLLDALKFSFSHRSLQARDLSDNSSKLSLMKPYVNLLKDLNSPECIKRNICDANWECIKEMGGDSVLCQLGTYTTSLLLMHSTDISLDSLYSAGRKGINEKKCKLEFFECNEIL